MLSIRPTRQAGAAAITTFVLLSILLYVSFQPRFDFVPTVIPLPIKSHTDSNLSSVPVHSDEETESSPTKHGTDLVTTTVLAHVHGFTVLENVYLKNGTLFIVHPDSASLGKSDKAEGYPVRQNLISKIADMKSGVDDDPTDQDLMFISYSSARGTLGTFTQRISGVTVLLHDPVQFMRHYYHFWGEIILGAWRVYTTISQRNVFPPTWSETEPMRFLMPFSDNGAWRDGPGVNSPLMRAAFPSAALEESDQWSDLQKLGATVVLDRVVLVDRHAAHRHPNSSVWAKMIASTMDVDAAKGFWEPIRQSVVKCILGYIPTVNEQGVVLNLEAREKSDMAPLVTYISRQGAGRRLTKEDDEGLVAALEGLEREGVIRFRLAKMEKMDLREQIELAAKTTVMVGVHGNGLTHQLWMPSSPWSTVMEILRPKSYVFDYEMLSRNAGHRHYAVWNDTFTTYPEGTYHQAFNYAVGFHENDIPVFGPAVAAQIRERLSERY
ncbi:Protein of unknown function (DUF563) domain containing protein [Amanita muscaria]